MRGIKFHGKLCKKCSTTEKYLKTNKCVSCNINYSQQYRKNNPDKIKERNKKDIQKKQEWVKNNPEKRKKSVENYYSKNKELLNEKTRIYYGSHKEALKVWRKEYDKEHKAERLAITRKYQLSKIQRIPKWLTKEDIEQIKEFYKNCPKGMHVDHIIPLQGKLVSGLHVLENLQYLSPEDNIKKGHKFEPLFIIHEE